MVKQLIHPEPLTADLGGFRIEYRGPTTPASLLELIEQRLANYPYAVPAINNYLLQQLNSTPSEPRPTYFDDRDYSIQLICEILQINAYPNVTLMIEKELVNMQLDIKRLDAAIVSECLKILMSNARGQILRPSFLGIQHRHNLLRQCDLLAIDTLGLDKMLLVIIQFNLSHEDFDQILSRIQAMLVSYLANNKHFPRPVWNDSLVDALQSLDIRLLSAHGLSLFPYKHTFTDTSTRDAVRKLVQATFETPES